MSIILSHPEVSKFPANISSYSIFTIPSLRLITASLLLGGLYLVFIHRYNQRHYKGPKTWPLLGCIIEQAKHFDVLHDWLLHYFEHLPTFSVPMMTVNNTFTSVPENVEYILKGNFANYPKGQRINERFVDMFGKGIFNIDGELWHQQRKVSSIEFSSSKLRDFSITAFQGQALQLSKILLEAEENSKIVDLQDLFMRMTLDSICKIGFGVDMGCLSPSLPAIPFSIAFDEASMLLLQRYVDFTWKIKRFFNLGAEARIRKCVEVVNLFIYKVIGARRKELQQNTFEQNEKKADILSRFMTMGGRNAYDDKMLRDVVVNFIIAGRDTTALTLSWLFSVLCRHPRVVDNILADVSAVLAAEEVNIDLINHSKGEVGLWERIVSFSECLSYQNLNKMYYLHAAISEALRLYPAVPLNSKEVVSDDVLPDGTRVKQGNFVSYAPYAMGRLERLWGPDAREFKPERWLADGIFQPQSPFKFTAFQAGPRICLGKDSAYLQIKMTTAILLKFFKFELLNPNEPVGYKMTLVLSIANGLKATVSLRHS